jgi:hypothetical protein
VARLVLLRILAETIVSVSLLELGGAGFDPLCGRPDPWFADILLRAVLASGRVHS